jgi:general secretion pathway protein K
MIPRGPRARRGARGVALLLAILVVTVLTILTVPFFYEGRVERAVSANLYTGLQAQYLAAAGVTFAEALVQEDARRRSGYDGLDEVWAQFNGVPVPLAGGTVAMSVTDENGKINLNNVADRNQQTATRWREIVERLLILQGQDAETARRLVATLVDWIDDNQTTESGAEADYYRTLDPPDTPPDAPLTTVQELRRIRDWTPKVVDSVAPFVTVYGGTRINVNTAPPEVLLALPEMDEGRVTDIVECRARTPLKNVGDLETCGSFSSLQMQAFTGMLATTTNTFGVRALGGFRDSVAVDRAVITRGNQITRSYWRAE